DARRRPAVGRRVGEGALEDVAGEGRPDVAERQRGDHARDRRQLVLGIALPHILHDGVAGVLAERAGQEADRAGEAPLVEELVEILGGGVVAVAPAGAQRLVHAGQQLLPGRYADSRADHEDGTTRADLIDQGLGDRVLGHPEPPRELCPHGSTAAPAAATSNVLLDRYARMRSMPSAARLTWRVRSSDVPPIAHT